jgi:lysophospholipase L1-like esterase
MNAPRLRRLLPLLLSGLLPLAHGADSQLAIPATDEGLPGAGPIRRYDWFRNLWLEKRSTWATRVEQDRNAVVFLGDSITQGWGEELGGAFPGLKVANRGISGDTTRGILVRMKEDVLALRPAAVVLLIGTNDLEEGADPAVIAANVRLILQRLREQDPFVPVVLCQVFPASATVRRPADKIREINRLYAEIKKGDRNTFLLETWPLFADAKGDAKASEFPDLLHPNAVGYAKWAAALRPVLGTLGFLEREPEPFTPEAGFESLFNGRDLTGWGVRVTPEADIQGAANWKKNDPNAPDWPIVSRAQAFDGLTKSPDHRYVARHGRIIVTQPPETRRIQQMWTTREFTGDFTLRLQFRATPNADSGVFLRGPQLQCRDYPIAGPYKDLKNYRAQDWNDLEVVVTGGTARCTCNGEVIEAAFKVPATGPIGLEGDMGQMEYRRIRIQQGR